MKRTDVSIDKTGDRLMYYTVYINFASEGQPNLHSAANLVHVGVLREDERQALAPAALAVAEGPRARLASSLFLTVALQAKEISDVVHARVRERLLFVFPHADEARELLLKHRVLGG